MKVIQRLAVRLIVLGLAVVFGRTLCAEEVKLAEAALNDGNVYAELEYDIIENLTASLSAAYMWLWDADIRDGASDIYMDTKHWTFGAKIAYAM